jgi:hypothetical protein
LIGHDALYQGAFNFGKRRKLTMINIRSLAIAAAVSAGVVFAMPTNSQAMQVKSKAHVQIGSQSNLETKKSDSWWRRHCRISNDVKCGRHYTKRHNGPYYGYYHRHRKSGVTVKVY